MIPNICHFIFGLKEQTSDFIFCYFLAVYSCYVINNPEKIYFYYHHEPYGEWWDKLKKIPNIELVKVEIPTHIGVHTIKYTAHRADILRMNILFQHGGIYLDIDTICVRPWKELLKEDVVLGDQPIKGGHKGICNAIMFTKPKSEFFRLWLDQYESEFRPDGWNESSIFLPFKLSRQYPKLVKILKPTSLFKPGWWEVGNIFKNQQNIPNELISLHLWESHSIKYMNNISNWDWGIENSHTLYGKIMLNILNKYTIVDLSELSQLFICYTSS